MLLMEHGKALRNFLFLKTAYDDYAWNLKFTKQQKTVILSI